MNFMKYPIHLTKVIEVLKKLPGVGRKSAERFAFEMLEWSQDSLNEMAETISLIPSKLNPCTHCGCLMDLKHCFFCDDSNRNATLCIIASPKDAFAIEATGEYKGLYHVLGGVLSPMEGFGPEKLNIEKLETRIKSLSITEIVVALDSTLEGDATSLYLKQELAPLNVQISRLAFGLPMGSSLDYVDGGTLARAFSGRGQF